MSLLGAARALPAAAMRAGFNVTSKPVLAYALPLTLAVLRYAIGPLPDPAVASVPPKPESGRAQGGLRSAPHRRRSGEVTPPAGHP